MVPATGLLLAAAGLGLHGSAMSWSRNFCKTGMRPSVCLTKVGSSSKFLGTWPNGDAGGAAMPLFVPHWLQAQSVERDGDGVGVSKREMLRFPCWAGDKRGYCS